MSVWDVVSNYAITLINSQGLSITQSCPDKPASTSPAFCTTSWFVASIKPLFQAMTRLKDKGIEYTTDQKLELCITLYLAEPGIKFHDVGNRLKDIMDSLAEAALKSYKSGHCSEI